jgi:hypothetical protein
MTRNYLRDGKEKKYIGEEVSEEGQLDTAYILQEYYHSYSV